MKKAKRAYEKPELVTYGDVNALTGAGGMASMTADGGSMGLNKTR